MYIHIPKILLPPEPEEEDELFTTPATVIVDGVEKVFECYAAIPSALRSIGCGIMPDIEFWRKENEDIAFLLEEGDAFFRNLDSSRREGIQEKEVRRGEYTIRLVRVVYGKDPYFSSVYLHEEIDGVPLRCKWHKPEAAEFFARYIVGDSILVSILHRIETMGLEYKSDGDSARIDSASIYDMGEIKVINRVKKLLDRDGYPDLDDEGRFIYTSWREYYYAGEKIADSRDFSSLWYWTPERIEIIKRFLAEPGISLEEGERRRKWVKA